MEGTLAATLIGDSHAKHAVAMLHGIYGRGRNLRSMAKAVAAARSDYACWLLDLPHHGESAAGKHGDTVVGMSQDVIDRLHDLGVVPRAILGHSYGGKVALAIADRLRHLPLQVWVIDSTPEVKPPSGSAWRMLELVRSLPRTFARREAAADALVARGLSRPVAQWMAQNLTPTDAGMVWKLDFDAMERLLVDFFHTDLWHVVESPAPGHDIHFLKASESGAISDTAVARLAAASGSTVHLHQREGGHWIHAESPQVVADLLVEHLPH